MAEKDAEITLFNIRFGGWMGRIVGIAVGLWLVGLYETTYDLLVATAAWLIRSMAP